MELPRNNISQTRGFTLVELLVVIALIGVLATMVLALVNPLAQFQRTRDTQRKNDLAQVQRSLEQYYNDFGNYPQNDASYQIKDPSGNSVPWGGTTNGWVYSNVLPKDPTSTQRYVYVSTGQSYGLYAHLERGGSDAQACNLSGNDCPNAPPTNVCGSGTTLSCSFGVSSSNTSP